DIETRAAAVKAITAIEEKENPRVIAVLTDIIAEKALPLDLRQEAVGRVLERNPAALAKATPALIRQLGDPSADVRRLALELLVMIIEDHRVEMPDRADDRCPADCASENHLLNIGASRIRLPPFRRALNGAVSRRVPRRAGSERRTRLGPMSFIK